MEAWVELVEWMQDKGYAPIDVRLILSLDALSIKSKEYIGQLEMEL